MECCVQINSENFYYICVVIYRPPKYTFEEFLKLTQKLKSKICARELDIIIGGDFNIDFKVNSPNVCLLEDLLVCFSISNFKTSNYVPITFL